MFLYCGCFVVVFQKFVIVKVIITFQYFIMLCYCAGLFEKYEIVRVLNKYQYFILFIKY